MLMRSGRVVRGGVREICPTTMPLNCGFVLRLPLRARCRVRPGELADRRTGCHLTRAPLSERQVKAIGSRFVPARAGSPSYFGLRGLCGSVEFHRRCHASQPSSRGLNTAGDGQSGWCGPLPLGGTGGLPAVRRENVAQDAPLPSGR